MIDIGFSSSAICLQIGFSHGVIVRGTIACGAFSWGDVVVAVSRRGGARGGRWRGREGAWPGRKGVFGVVAGARLL